MQKWILPLLRCPRHQCQFVLRAGGVAGDTIESGVLQCAAGGCEFPIDDGIADFVPGDKYVESFSTQRKLLRRVFEGYIGTASGANLFVDSRISADEFRQGITLDAGCGYGRFTHVISAAGGRVVGVDLSMTSLRLVKDALGDRPGVCLIHADLYELPFADESFDRVISMGVLHHTPSTREGFRRVSRLVRPGGKCCIYVYENYSLMRKAIDVHRRWTQRIPEWLLIWLLSLNQILFHWLRRIPVLGRLAFALFPCDFYLPGWRKRLTTDFDIYAPKYAFSHRYDEVYEWFVEEGFGDIQIGRHGIIWMSGTRRRDLAAMSTPLPATANSVLGS